MHAVSDARVLSSKAAEQICESCIPWRDDMAAVDDSKKRRYERHAFSRAIEYVAPPGDAKRVIKGYAINISEAGLCFASTDVIKEGQEIGIKTELPVMHRKGIVVWSRKIDETLYKAGLRFL